jgi:HSP20 family protein
MKTYACRPTLRSAYRPYGSAFVPAPLFRAPGQTALRNTRPATNIVRGENGYEIHMAVPGVPKDQIRIEMKDDLLHVTATNNNQETGTKFLRQEFDYKSFHRTFTLHNNADVANLKASFADGILTIVVPDKEPSTRKIDIQ